jgi:arylsulfatase A-like enzyme
MKMRRNLRLGLLALFAAAMVAGAPAHAQQKPNILVIMGDDVGWFNIGAYHQGMMSGKTPNLDKLAAEGMRFTDYYAEASCTAGRANFITGELPIRTGLTTVGQPGADRGDACGGLHHRHRPQGARLRHRAVRQEPPRRLE